MILYTSMPLELVFPVSESEHSKYTCITYKGVSMMVEYESPNAYRIHRVLSTDPMDYLKAEYCPGSLISFQGNEHTT